jgi:hypothetical protein
VTVTGKNFTSIGNTITLGDGPVQVSFANLPSPDGRTVTFTYQPPVVRGMSEAEIRALPPQTLAQIETPIKAAGYTLSDVLKSYQEQGLKSESDLRLFLEKNGYSFDEMYHRFWIIADNANGRGISDSALLRGMRQLPFAGTAATDFSLMAIIRGAADSLKKLFPLAYAQGGQAGGGFFTTVMICTCSGGFLDFMMDYSGGGSGLYYFFPGFRPNAGSGLGSGQWLGYYQPGGGVCTIIAFISCIPIQANAPQNPWGASF